MNTPKDLPEFISALQQAQKTAFKIGEKSMLEKVLEIYEQKKKGLYSEEEFERVLRDYQKEFYERNKI